MTGEVTPFSSGTPAVASTPSVFSGGAPLRILYATVLSRTDSSLYRMWALQRLGAVILPFDTNDFLPANPLLSKITFRLAAGPWVNRLNRDLLNLAERERPDLVWTDKLLGMQPRTLQKLRAMGIATVSYMIDNPFGPRRDPGWRLYRKDIPFYDLHVVQRDANIADYMGRGARDVIKIQTAYEPAIHFPPPPGWSDADRDREVSFIGTPYDQRGEFLTRLWKEFGIPVAVSGTERLWPRALSPDAFAALFRGGEVYLKEYREAIWRSKINLSFLTHSNQDEFAHKSFEIAGCGSFLLAERSPGHAERFKEDEEAVFFSSVEECAAKIRRWLPDETGRARIAAAGAARAQASGYYNDVQVQAILARANEIVLRMRRNTLRA
jgi:spore maturation protein CgeB